MHKNRDNNKSTSLPLQQNLFTFVEEEKIAYSDISPSYQQPQKKNFNEFNENDTNKNKHGENHLSSLSQNTENHPPKNNAPSAVKLKKSNITKDAVDDDLKKNPDPKSSSSSPLSVSEVVAQIGGAIRGCFKGEVCVQGEISGLKVSSSGHSYFSLKDSGALINAISWRSLKSNIKIENGTEVICCGTISHNPDRSNYQIIISKIEFAGIGRLMAIIEERKNKLSREGLFDPKHKKPIPSFPKIICIITSPTGAVIQDMMHRISERYPAVEILLYGVTVQGKEASNEIAMAIKNINDFDFRKKQNMEIPDIIIVARGGGSFEDLLPFNEENLVRAAFASNIPLISAIGHETDHTLLDLVADHRAPTPTAAAEKSVPVLEEIQEILEKNFRIIESSIIGKINHLSLLLENMVKKVTTHSILIDKKQEKMQLIARGLEQAIGNYISSKEVDFERIRNSLEKYPGVIFAGTEKRYNEQLIVFKNGLWNGIIKIIHDREVALKNINQLLNNSDYSTVLRRGFVIVEKKSETGSQVVSSANDIKNGDELKLLFKDGNAAVRVIDILSDIRE